MNIIKKSLVTLLAAAALNCGGAQEDICKSKEGENYEDVAKLGAAANIYHLPFQKVTAIINGEEGEWRTYISDLIKGMVGTAQVDVISDSKKIGYRTITVEDIDTAKKRVTINGESHDLMQGQKVAYDKEKVDVTLEGIYAGGGFTPERVSMSLRSQLEISVLREQDVKLENIQNYGNIMYIATAESQLAQEIIARQVEEGCAVRNLRKVTGMVAMDSAAYFSGNSDAKNNVLEFVGVTEDNVTNAINYFGNWNSYRERDGARIIWFGEDGSIVGTK